MLMVTSRTMTPSETTASFRLRNSRQMSVHCDSLEWTMGAAAAGATAGSDVGVSRAVTGFPCARTSFAAFEGNLRVDEDVHHVRNEDAEERENRREDER